MSKESDKFMEEDVLRYFGVFGALVAKLMRWIDKKGWKKK